MTNFTNYVYSKAAASRIFEKKAESVLVERDRATITFSDGTTASTTTSRFKEHFAEHRRQQAKDLSPMPGKDNLWHVGNYRIAVHPDRLSCNCRDWLNQSAIGLKTPCCKHVYAVLNTLGCNSLAEYLGKNSEARSSSTATNQRDEDTHQLSSSLAEAPQLPKVPQWILYWESYGRDRATGEPLETAETRTNRKPTNLEIWDLRKNAHSKGFKLVSIELVKQPA